MKRISLLLLTVMALASHAWGAWASCASELGNTYYCQWPTGCYEINKGADDTGNCQTAFNGCKEDGYLYTGVTNAGDNATCNGSWAEQGNDPSFNGGVKIWCKWATGCQPLKNQIEKDGCVKDGSVFKDVPTSGIGDGKTCAGGTWTEEGKDPNATVLGCCKWSTETKCYPIFSGIDPIDGNEGTTKVASCQTGSNIFWNGSGACPESCPTTTPTYPASSSSIAASSSSGGSSSSSGTSSSSSDGSTPIISYNKAPVVGLNVVSFARNLQIASGKDATVSLFDMRGKQVFSQKVLSGTTTISLEKQKQGVYYAVVRSGSQKQTVKVILK